METAGDRTARMGLRSIQHFFGQIVDAGAPNPYADLTVALYRAPRGKLHADQWCRRWNTRPEATEHRIADISGQVCSKCSRNSVTLPYGAVDYFLTAGSISGEVANAFRRVELFSEAVSARQFDRAFARIRDWASGEARARERLEQLASLTTISEEHKTTYITWAEERLSQQIPAEQIQELRTQIEAHATISRVTTESKLQHVGQIQHDTRLNLPSDLAGQVRGLLGDMGTAAATWVVNAACGTSRPGLESPDYVSELSYQAARAAHWQGPFVMRSEDFTTPHAWLKSEWLAVRDRVLGELVTWVRDQLTDLDERAWLVSTTEKVEPAFEVLWPSGWAGGRTVMVVSRDVAELLSRQGWAAAAAPDGFIIDDDISVTLSFVAGACPTPAHLGYAAELAVAVV